MWIRIVVIILTLVFSHWAKAQSSARLRTAGGANVLISADSIYRDSEKGLVELKGRVQVIYEDQHLSCDEALINTVTQEVDAKGNLKIWSATSYVEGSRAVVNYEKNTGVIYNGFIRSGRVSLEGEVLRKLAPDVYEAERANYTACDSCPPVWQFAGTRIHAEMGGYAHIRNAIFKITYVPVLWLPYLIVPLKSERQTGLLVPIFEFSQVDEFHKGIPPIGIPFFWAISRSQDALFTYKNLAKQGQKFLINYRYVLTPSSAGEANLGYVRDKKFLVDPQVVSFADNPPTDRRWFYSYNHYYELPENFTQRLKLNLVSDLLYPRDFTDDIAGYGDPSLENRLSLAHNSESTHASVDTSYYVNLEKPNPLSSNTDSVQRFPEVRVALADQRLGQARLLANMNVHYVNFARQSTSYDDVVFRSATRSLVELNPDERGRFQNDSSAPSKTVYQKPGAVIDPTVGIFNPGTDVVRTGQRIDFQPEVSAPFQMGPYVDALPSLTLRHTQYALDVNPPADSGYDTTPSQQMIRGRLSARSRFSATYVDLGSATLNRYKHEIVPEVVLNTTPYLAQNDSTRCQAGADLGSGCGFFRPGAKLPLFLAQQPVSDQDFYDPRANGIQFDYFDRTLSRNYVTFLLNNKLIRRRRIAGTDDYLQIVGLKLSQSYDYDEATKDENPRYPWSDIAATLDIRLDHFETSTKFQYYPYHNYTNTSARMRVTNTRQDYLELSYSQAFLITKNPDEAYAKKSPDSFGVESGITSRYVNVSGKINYKPESYTPMDFQIQSWQALFVLKPPGDCWFIQYSVEQILKSDRKHKVTFDYRFGG